MNSLLHQFVIFLVILTLTAAREYDTTEIHGYHFHTYFFQNNFAISKEAVQFRSDYDSTKTKKLLHY